MIDWVGVLMPMAVILVQAGLIVALMFRYYPGEQAFIYQASIDEKTNDYAKKIDHKNCVTQSGSLGAAKNGILRNVCRRYPVISRKLEHERTPGEVAVMCAEPKGIAGGAHPLLCPTRQNDSTQRRFLQRRASDGRFSVFPAK